MAEGSSDEVDGAWSRTVAELRLLGDELESDGWEVAPVVAGHVTPEPPGAGDTDRFGLVYVVPGDDAEAFTDAFETGEFTEYEVFRQRVGQRLYLVTKLADSAERLAILLAGSVDLTRARPLVEAAGERGEMYTHVQLLDGTPLGSFAHDAPGLFFEELADEGA